jgi:hypothetical protein
MKLLEWLCPAQINPNRDQATYKELLTENTAAWIFDDPAYKDWRLGSTSFLWIFGESIYHMTSTVLTLIVGAGKSVLTYLWSHRNP